MKESESEKLAKDLNKVIEVAKRNRRIAQDIVLVPLAIFTVVCIVVLIQDMFGR